MKGLRVWLFMAVAASISLSVMAAPTTVAHAASAERRSHYGPTAPDPASARDEVGSLQPGWRSSKDELWTLRGDATGLHLLAASARSAYSWRTVATLGDPSVETDRWIGNACLTRSGHYAVVVYAPRSFTNRTQTFLRGGRVAVVDMRSGAVRAVSIRGSLAYYDPGCGVADDAVITQSRFPEESGKPMATRIFRLHAATGTLDTTIEKAGQYSSAVPVEDGVVARVKSELVHLDAKGAETTMMKNVGGAFELAVDAGGGVVFLRGAESANEAVRVSSSGSASVVARAAGHWLGVARGVGGRVFVQDPAGRDRTVGQGVTLIRSAVRDEVSTLGEARIVAERTPPPSIKADSWRKAQTLATGADSVAEVDLEVRIRSTGDLVGFRVKPSTGPAAEPTRSPTQGPSRHEGTLGKRVAGTTAVTYTPGTADASPSCAIPRNDPKTQVYQPTPRQVEWAADQAVVNNLLTARPYNWKQSGLASWTPQKMFPSKPLVGGGRVPVQILLGILAQESNLWQASGHALSGEFGNPLVGDYYGRGGGWDISYKDADCGYGIGQVTDGMRKPAFTTSEMPPALPSSQQRAIALDYETNIARALQILQEKWNQTTSAGLIHDDGNPASLENWIFAVWAYNTGFHPNAGDGSGWGVGWFNNPANPIYDENRGFFNESPSDAAHPSRWPYQEKVIGWAAYSIATPDGPGFRPAWWVSDTERAKAEPYRGTFCDSSNNCTLDAGCPALNSTCYWHKPVLYHDCQHGFCGHELLRFNTTYPEQPDGTHYPPVCTLAGLPTGSMVIDDVPATVKAPVAGCGHPWTEKGKFTLGFASPSGRIDFHQISGGLGGHFWFAHTRKSGDVPDMEAVGTWKYTTYINKWGRLLVHLPDHGAETQQAAYQVNLGNGVIKTRYLPQRRQANTWVSLGVMQFKGYPSVTLSSQTFDGKAIDDVAWDAVAIQPLSAKPKDFVVAMGDSYSSGEGANDPSDGDDYYRESDYGGSLANDKGRNACHRSPWAWSRKAVLADSSLSIGARADSNDVTMDYHLIACSGAESENLLPYHSVPVGAEPPSNDWKQTGQGQYGELSQMDQGYLDENTTLVLFSIGGNDAQFGPVVKHCLTEAWPSDCQDQTFDGMTAPARDAVPAWINGPVARSVATVLDQVHSRAPNARILLMGYPALITSASGLSCSISAFVSDGEMLWIDEMSIVMNNALLGVVDAKRQTGVQIQLGNPVSDFSGVGICGDPEDINGIVLNKTSGDEAGVPQSQQSFHPKIVGTTLYSQAANRALRALGQ